MLQQTIQTFPHDFHGYKLLQRLGGGFVSDAYLAETPKFANIPRHICLKIATNNCPGAYTEESANADFLYQKEVLQKVQHPFIIRILPDVLPDVPGCLATELAVCTLQELQAALDDRQHEWSNRFAPVTVKYIAAQLFLAVSHMHQNNIRWDDVKQVNIVIMPDFTLRIIDVGATFHWAGAGARDHHHMAGTLHNLSTTSKDPFLNQSLEYYKELFRTFKAEIDPDLLEMLGALLDQRSFQDLLGHRYWTSTFEDDAASSVDLVDIVGKEVEGLRALRVTAWRALPHRAQDWLISKGVSA